MWLALGILLVVVAARFPNSPVTGFTFDTGIQLNLSQLTLDGAVPLRDFEHGWNAGSFYLGAALLALVGRNADLWWYAFTVGGQLLAGLSVIWLLRERRVGQLWLLVLTVGWLGTAYVAHLKYATPLVVLAVLVWTWRLEDRWRLPVTIGMFAVLVVTHVELAVLLGAGLSLHELAAADRATPRRLLAVAAAPLGVLLGLCVQLAVYARLGVGAGEVLRQLIGDQTVVDPDAHFGYPLLSPGDVRTALVPALLLIPFLPAVWSSLHRITRLTACLQLAMVVILLRRTDSAHIAAATTLLPLLVGLVVLDVQPRLAAVRATGIGAVATRWWAAGAVGLLGVITVAFTSATLLAGAALFAGALGGIAMARWASPQAGPASMHGRTSVVRASRTASVTLGGLTAAVALLLTSSVGAVVSAAEDLPGDELTREIAGPLAAPLAECSEGDPQVWVVPHPLGLYDALDLQNPTPFVMFHYPFLREHDRVLDLVDAGRIGTIVTYGPWLPSFEGLDAELESRYAECAVLTPPEVPGVVRVLRWRGPEGR